MKLAIILFYMMVTAAIAGWDTNAWPSYEHPRKGYEQALNCHSALTERVQAAQYDDNVPSLPSAPSFYRVQKTNLQNMKDKMKTIIPYYWSTNFDLVANFNSYTTAPGYYDSISGIVTNWTINSLCQSLCLPTNYFDYTPYRCLDGSGPFTNDTTVGRPHGWSVANGGSYYPSGRTNWYTSDYGWASFPAICSALVVRAFSIVAIYDIGPTGSVWQSRFYTSDVFDPPWNWADAQSSALAGDQRYTPAASAFFGPYTDGQGEYYNASSNYYTAKASMNIVAAQAYHGAGPTAAVQVIFRTWWPTAQMVSDGTYNSAIYDDNGYGYNNAGAWRSYLPYNRTYGWQSETNVSINVVVNGGKSFLRYSAILGETNQNSLTWCNDPTPIGTAGQITTRGFWHLFDDGVGGAHQTRQVIKLDFSKGFKF